MFEMVFGVTTMILGFQLILRGPLFLQFSVDVLLDAFKVFAKLVYRLKKHYALPVIPFSKLFFHVRLRFFFLRLRLL